MSSFIEKIGIDNVLNVILVNENVRPAMLVQPADYDERTHNDPKTKSIIETITPFYISNADFYIVLNHIKIIYSSSLFFVFYFVLQYQLVTF